MTTILGLPAMALNVYGDIRSKMSDSLTGRLSVPYIKFSAP